MRKILFCLAFLIAAALLIPARALAAGGQIRGWAFQDNGDGLFHDDARALAGVTVSLYTLADDGTETLAARQNTDSSGYYGFDGLEKGTYRLRAVLPEGYCFIMPAAGGSVMMPAPGTSSFSLPIELDVGGLADRCCIGVSRSATYIKVIAFEDTNQNGGRSTAETLLRGVGIQLLYETEGQLVQISEAKTDMNGEAYFYRLTPGTYRIAATLPEPYIIGPIGDKTDIWHNCIPPQDSRYGVSDPVTSPKGDSLGVGVSAVSTGRLQGSLWLDTDRDGKQDASESGYPGAVVKLENEDAGVSRTLSSGSDGRYRFDGLLAGDYTLTVTLPGDVMYTIVGDSLFSDGYTSSQSCIVTVEALTEGVIPPIGVTAATSLKVHLYNDLNANGACDAGEPDFAGAVLEVLVNDRVRAQTYSDENGIARIPVLREGECDICLKLPDGQVITVAGPDNDFYTPSATGNLTQPFQIEPASENAYSAGVTLPASVSGILFNDADLSGIMEGSESGLSGFTVRAVNADGETVCEVLTDSDGRYKLPNLLPSPHTVRFMLQDAYVCTDYSESGAPAENHVTAQTPSYGETAVLSLSAGQTLEGVSCGIFRSATVSGQVLLDSGVPSLPEEGGLKGVLVQLLDEYGLPVSETTRAYTDESGSFFLKGALPGSYMLEYILPENAAFTLPETGESSVSSALFSLEAAQDMQAGRLLGVYTGSLNGTLYRDSDLNGMYDAGEPVLPGISVYLENTELQQTYETVTLDNGQFVFESLRPGDFTIRVSLPDGLCFVRDDSSLIAAQSESEALCTFSLGIGEMMESRDIAAAEPASLEGRICFDPDNDGVTGPDDPGAEGVTLTLTGDGIPVSYSLQTAADGSFSLQRVVPGPYTLRVTLPASCIPAEGNSAQLVSGFWESPVYPAEGEQGHLVYNILKYGSISGHVWNMDGSLQGVDGRKVSLYANDGELPLAECLTDDEGAFVFADLKPGMYRLACDLPDSRYDFAREEDAVLRPSRLPGLQSDIPADLRTSFPLNMGEDLAACDIGIGALGALGDTAWLDLNGNGLQDGSEPPLPGIAIRLYQYGKPAAETVTDNHGRYLIENLYPGTYTVQVTVPAEVKTTLHRTDYPLASSVLPEGLQGTAEAEGIPVPSAGRNLNCDLGFTLLQEGVFPAGSKDLHQTDWSFGTAD